MKTKYLGSWCSKIFLGIFFVKSGAYRMNNALGHIWSLDMNQASKVYVIIHTATSCIQLTVIFTVICLLFCIKERENPAIDRETTAET